MVMIGFWADPEFAAKIDEARKSVSRSQFARDALEEKLRAMHIPIAREKVIAPDRVGKGGRPSHRPKSAINSDQGARMAEGAALVPAIVPPRPTASRGATRRVVSPTGSGRGHAARSAPEKGRSLSPPVLVPGAPGNPV